MKVCTKCGAEKPLSEFYPDGRPVNKRCGDGRLALCKKCKNTRNKNWTLANKAHHTTLVKRWASENKERHYAKSKQWRADNRERAFKTERATLLKRVYGITPEQANDLLAAQGGVCAICRIDNPRSRFSWHIDHDHNTGAVRGILCARCNQMLGFALDNRVTLETAACYLEVHGC